MIGQLYRIILLHPGCCIISDECFINEGFAGNAFADEYPPSEYVLSELNENAVDFGALIRKPQVVSN